MLIGPQVRGIVHTQKKQLQTCVTGRAAPAAVRIVFQEARYEGQVRRDGKAMPGSLFLDTIRRELLPEVMSGGKASRQKLLPWTGASPRKPLSPCRQPSPYTEGGVSPGASPLDSK